MDSDQAKGHLATLSPNAQKAILLFYIADTGFNTPGSTSPEHALQKLCGMSADEAYAALMELADRGFIARVDNQGGPMTVIINGAKHDVPADVTYELVVALACNGRTDGRPTVTYHGAQNGDGELLPGQTVQVRDDAVFNVLNTASA